MNIGRIQEALRRLEWSNVMMDMVSQTPKCFCPSCHREKKEGHRGDCITALAMDELRSPIPCPPPRADPEALFIAEVELATKLLKERDVARREVAKQRLEIERQRLEIERLNKPDGARVVAIGGVMLTGSEIYTRCLEEVRIRRKLEASRDDARNETVDLLVTLKHTHAEIRRHKCVKLSDKDKANMEHCADLLDEKGLPGAAKLLRVAVAELIR